jgi:hypothetical protein
MYRDAVRSFREALLSAVPLFPERSISFVSAIFSGGATNRQNPGSYDLLPFSARRGNLFQERRSFMFLILAVVLVVLWLGGFFVLHISSFFIHLLLIFALISIIMNFVSGRRAV